MINNNIKSAWHGSEAFLVRSFSSRFLYQVSNLREWRPRKEILVACPIRLRVHTRLIWKSKSLIIGSVQSVFSRWVALGGFGCLCLVPPRLVWLGWLFLSPTEGARSSFLKDQEQCGVQTEQAEGLKNKKTVFNRIDMREICQVFQVLWRPAEMPGCVGT